MRSYLARLAFSAAALALLAVLVDPVAVARRLSGLAPAWLLPIAAVSVAQFALSAWRWRFTAGRLGLALPARQALAEYYVAVFLNQVLPAGVMGDAARAWRHGAVTRSRLPALQAVVIERVSGQLALALVVAASLPMLPGALAPGPVLPTLLVVGVGVLPLAAAARVLVRRRPDGALSRALLSRTALPLQLTSSLLVLASYVAIYALTARALGVTRPAAELLPLIPPVLLAMALPLSVAGWGLREGAAAMVWSAAGLPVAEGVAIAVGYGLVNLLAAGPGAVILLLGRGRRAVPGQPPDLGAALTSASTRSNSTSAPR